MDDFAHHPTAVRETIQAVKPFYPAGRLIAVFEPRTNSSKRKIFQEDYIAALSKADFVYLKIPPGLENLPEETRLDLMYVKRSLEKLGKKVYLFK